MRHSNHCSQLSLQLNTVSAKHMVFQFYFCVSTKEICFSCQEEETNKLVLRNRFLVENIQAFFCPLLSIFEALLLLLIPEVHCFCAAGNFCLLQSDSSHLSFFFSSFFCHCRYSFNIGIFRAYNCFSEDIQYVYACV